MFFKRAAALLALALGLAGIAACLAGAYGVWLAASRLDVVADRAFDAVDRSLAVVEDRTPLVQQRLRESKLTIAEVAAALREWGEKKAQDRIAAALRIESMAEKLSNHLQTADLRLEASRETIREIRQVLEVGQSLGVNVDPASLDAVQERFESLQESLQQAEQAVDGFRKFTDTDSVENRRARVAKLAARILLTLSEADQRLDDLAARVSEVRTQSRLRSATTSRWIVLGSVVCYGLLAWIGIGQAALCGWGWTRFRARKRRSPDSTRAPLSPFGDGAASRLRADRAD